MTAPLRFTALAVGLALSATQAGADTLTFDTLAVGTTLSNQYAGQGVTFSANAFSGAGTSTSGQPWASNSDMTIVSSTGTDVGGLGTPSLVSGNVLRSFNGWLGEDGDPSFMVSFAAPVSTFSADFAGVSTAADVTMWFFNGATPIGSVSGTGTSTGQFTLSFAAPAFTSVAIRPGSFNDWVGVDNVSFTAAVPEASTYAMMALGLGLLAWRRRRA